MSLARKAAGSVLWNYAARLADSAGLYLLHLIIARALGVAQYGIFAFLMSGAQFLLTASSLAFETSLNRTVPALAADPAEGEGAVRFLVRKVLMLRLGILAPVCIAAYFSFFLVSSFPDAPLLGPALLIGFVIVRSLGSLLGVVLTAELETGLIARITLLVRLLELAGTVLLVSWGAGMHLIFGWLLATGALHVFLYAARFRPPLVGPVRPLPLKPFLAFSGVFYINMLADFVLGRYGDIVLLTRLLPTPDQAGLYGAAAGLVNAAGVAATMGLAGVMLALFSGIPRGEQDSEGKTRRLYRVTVRLVSALTLPLFAFLVFNARPLVVLLFGEQFGPAAPLVQALAFLRLLTRFLGGGENADLLLASGHVKLVSACGVGAALVNILGDIVLIPGLEAWGAVIASGTANLLVTAGTGYAVYKTSGAPWQPGYHLRLSGACLLASYLAGLCGNFLDPQTLPYLRLLVQLPLFVFLAGSMMLILKPFEDEDLKLVTEIRPALAPYARALVRP